MLVGTSTSCWLATTFFFFVFCFVCTSLKALVRSASGLTLGPDGPGSPTSPASTVVLGDCGSCGASDRSKPTCRTSASCSLERADDSP